MSDTHIWNVDVIEPAVTGSAIFQETAPQNGDLVHADFTWANASFNGAQNTYATMYILDPNGMTVAVYDEGSDSSGSHQLTYVIDMPGTWTAQIAIWDGNDWVNFIDTVAVDSPYFEIVFPQSTFETGPVEADSQIYACVLTVANTGNVSSNGLLRLYEFPNTSNEQIIGELPIATILAGGVLSNIVVPATAPSTEGSWPLGIKVYGIGEPAPAW